MQLHMTGKVLCVDQFILICRSCAGKYSEQGGIEHICVETMKALTTGCLSSCWQALYIGVASSKFSLFLGPCVPTSESFVLIVTGFGSTFPYLQSFFYKANIFQLTLLIGYFLPKLVNSSMFWAAEEPSLNFSLTCPLLCFCLDTRVTFYWLWDTALGASTTAHVVCSINHPLLEGLNMWMFPLHYPLYLEFWSGELWMPSKSTAVGTGFIRDPDCEPLLPPLGLIPSLTKHKPKNKNFYIDKIFNNYVLPCFKHV